MLSIRENAQKIKSRGSILVAGLDFKQIYIVLLIIVVALLSYGLGRLSKIEEGRQPVRIENIEIETIDTAPEVKTSALQATVSNVIETDRGGEIGGKYVGSINSTKYHLPWCSGAKRISEANQVWFASKEEAETKGYSPAANCPGI